MKTAVAEPPQAVPRTSKSTSETPGGLSAIPDHSAQSTKIRQLLRTVHDSPQALQMHRLHTRIDTSPRMALQRQRIESFFPPDRPGLTHGFRPAAGKPHQEAVQRKPRQAMAAERSTVFQLMGKGEALENLATVIKSGSDQSRLKTALDTLALKEDQLDVLVDRILKSGMPQSYVPTTVEMWMNFINKILQYEAEPLRVSDETGHEETDSNMELTELRRNILARVGKQNAEVKPVKKKLQIMDDLDVLRQKLLRAEITINLPLDKLFLFHTPHYINSFEAEAQFGKKTENIATDSLLEQRLEAEQSLFGLVKVPPRLRPRYAALNVGGHPFGSASRNDYGLSHYKLADHVRQFTTFTLGDTFDTLVKSAFTLTPDGIEAAIHSLATIWEEGINQDLKPLIDEQAYKSDHFYFDTQIHTDIDIRKDVKEIVVSKAEMVLFGVTLDQVDKLIHNMTSGVFVREE